MIQSGVCRVESGDSRRECTARYKSKRFAIRVVHLYQYLCNEKKEYTISKQLLRSGTSIGANLAESECAMSRKDFLAKVYISLKECNEALYWLELLYDTEYLRLEEYQSMYADCKELQRMLSATTRTLQTQLTHRE